MDCSPPGFSESNTIYIYFNIYFIWLCWVLVAVHGIWFCHQGSNPGLLHWELGVLATGPQGISQECKALLELCLFHVAVMWLWASVSSPEWHHLMTSLETAMATPVLLPGKSHGRRSLVGCSPWGREESNMTEQLHFPFSLSCIGEGNGNPLQCSCLENPRDGEAWWAAVYEVAQSRTRLK